MKAIRNLIEYTRNFCCDSDMTRSFITAAERELEDLEILVPSYDQALVERRKLSTANQNTDVAR